MTRINLNSGANTHKLNFEDLKEFKRTMKARETDFKRQGIRSGIHAQTVINRSRRQDIDRFQQQINTAIPARCDKNGVIQFRVNASAQSKDSHHLVAVEFLDFHHALSGGRITNQLAKTVLGAALRFDCDCGRHRYWYRYLATVGGFAYGKPETGFPKIRNPQLTGLACKHVLFVMRMLLRSPLMVGKMKEYLQTYRQNPVQKTKTLGKNQARAFEEKINKEGWQKIKVRRTGSHSMPKKITDAFDPNKKHSIRGLQLSPDDLAKLKYQQMDKGQQLKEIQRAQMTPDLPPEVQQALSVLNAYLSTGEK